MLDTEVIVYVKNNKKSYKFLTDNKLTQRNLLMETKSL